MVKKEKTTWCHLPDGGNGHPSTSYWIPVTGQPDYYFHFGIGITIDYAKNPTEEYYLPGEDVFVHAHAHGAKLTANITAE